MYIETFIFLAIFIFVCLICLVALVGWTMDSRSLKEASLKNEALAVDNAELMKENRALKAKLSFLRQVREERNGKV